MKNPLPNVQDRVVKNPFTTVVGAAIALGAVVAFVFDEIDATGLTILIGVATTFLGLKDTSLRLK